jgi:hypothetical protein
MKEQKTGHLGTVGEGKGRMYIEGEWSKANGFCRLSHEGRRLRFDSVNAKSKYEASYVPFLFISTKANRNKEQKEAALEKKNSPARQRYFGSRESAGEWQQTQLLH